MAKKKSDIIIKCPFCGCRVLMKPDLKVKRFPKTHFFKFACGFAWLYNKKTEKVFVDIDWRCHEVDGEQKMKDKELVKISERFFRLTENSKKGDKKCTKKKRK